jgi:hypothetical protein
MRLSGDCCDEIRLDISSRNLRFILSVFCFYKHSIGRKH